MVVLYEEHATILYNIIEELEEGNITYSELLFIQKFINKTHYEYLGETLLDISQNGEIIEIDNLYLIVYYNNYYIKIDIDEETNLIEPLFRIQKQKKLSKLI